ncbi:hypothetical protein [Myxococcus sp. Y35]|uniref:hypothetical protein n=1 Tax=Pseudomyxococcus flavus TaxID=3115648 RepID=UPI003CF718AF
MTTKQTSAEAAPKSQYTIQCARTGFKPSKLTVSPGDTVEFLGNPQLEQHVRVLKAGIADHTLFGTDDFLVPNDDKHRGLVLTVSMLAERTTYTIVLKNRRVSLEPMNGTITVNRGTHSR